MQAFSTWNNGISTLTGKPEGSCIVIKSFNLDTCGLAIVDIRSKMGKKCENQKERTLVLTFLGRPISRPFKSTSAVKYSCGVMTFLGELEPELLGLLLLDAATSSPPSELCSSFRFNFSLRQPHMPDLLRSKLIFSISILFVMTGALRRALTDPMGGGMATISPISELICSTITSWVS
ncbi:hypothetical protein FF38_06702 [Lucilia cuprina]|uniref:Uncharacterized protein n=1 Tax=Lucilia cuprina TaxID=7375 RepID=A0A0L0C1E9_LUCCU|nr:hypothetical protein FF38_06702 [Lucilia cuprina]